MATPNRLLVRDIQIYFDGDRALHGCRRALDLSAIQTELGEYRDFIDRWLEASELPKPVRLSDEEEALLYSLRKTAVYLKKIFPIMSIAEIQGVLTGLAEATADRYPTLSKDQRENLAEDAVSTL
jgi:hypothetical protein